MREVSITELRRRGGRFIDEVVAGERVVVTRRGRPVVELRRLQSNTRSAAVLLRRWRQLPQIDPERLRVDPDAMFDSSL